MKYNRPEIKVSRFEVVYASDAAATPAPNASAVPYDVSVSFTELLYANSEKIQELVEYRE